MQISRNFVILAICLVLLVGLAYREWSWRSHSHTLETKVKELEFDFDSAVLLLQVQHSSHDDFETLCLLDSVSDVPKTLISDFIVYHSDARIAALFNYSLSNKPTVVESSRRSLFDISGLMLIGLLNAVKILEISFMHTTVYKESNCFVSYNSNRAFHSFVKKWTPVTTMITFWLLWLSGMLAWFGILHRPAYLLFGLKLFLSFNISTILAPMLVNAYGIRAYLPKSTDAWKESTRTPTWWLWLVSCILGVDSLETFLVWALQCFGIVYFSWPFWYLYLYKESFTASAVVVDVFANNMITQVAFLFCGCASISLKLFGSPPWFRNHRIISFLNPIFIDSVSGYTQIPVLLILTSVLLAILRVTWFVFTGGCGWWGATVMWVFIAPQIIIPLGHLSIISTQVTRVRLLDQDRQPFVAQFADQIDQIVASVKVGTSDELNKSNDAKIEVSDDLKGKTNQLANGFFNALVDRCMRSYALGAGPITYQSYDERNKTDSNEGTSEDEGTREKKQTDNSDKSLTDLRQAFEYTTVEFSMANSHFREALRMSIQHHWTIPANDSGAELTDAVMEKLLLEMSVDERIETIAHTFSYLLGARVQLK